MDELAAAAAVVGMATGANAAGGLGQRGGSGTVDEDGHLYIHALEMLREALEGCKVNLASCLHLQELVQREASVVVDVIVIIWWHREKARRHAASWASVTSRVQRMRQRGARLLGGEIHDGEREVTRRVLGSR